MNLKNTIIEIKKELLSQKHLLKKAAAFKTLELTNEVTTTPVSQSIGCYELTDPGFVKALEQNGFKLTKRPDGIITLSDENPQVKISGCAPSNYWNFLNNDERKDPLQLTLHLAPFLNQRKRGVIFTPVVYGTFLSAVDRLPNSRIFKVVAKYDPGAHLVVKTVADNDELVVNWTDVQLGGIRSLDVLFDEVRNDVEEFNDLARSSISPFDPAPYPQDTQIDQEKYYLPEKIQPLLFDVWQAQLDEFKEKF